MGEEMNELENQLFNLPTDELKNMKSFIEGVLVGRGILLLSKINVGDE